MTESKSPYTHEFYKDQQSGSISSAKEIVPYITKLTNPKSVLDVGCGIGTWLSVFKNQGVKNIMGVDGHWVDKNYLMIPSKDFMHLDLKKPIKLTQKFDLVVSLEVAEHLPKLTAEQFIKSITSLGDVVLFSAAIPYQGGTDHINEQWQDYWAQLFELNGFVTIDCIRKRFWRNSKVAFFYAQNMLLYVRKSKLTNYPQLRDEYKKTNREQISIVHPQRYTDIGKQKVKISKLVPSFVKKLYLSLTKK